MGLEQPILIDVEESISFEMNRRDFAQLSAPEKTLVDMAGFIDLAPIEAWTATGTNRSLQYATHGMFRYFGKFPPPVATHLINHYSSPGGLVLDPMCGSGTTGVECLLHDRQGVLCDISPLSLLLSRVKTTYLPTSKLTQQYHSILAAYPKVDASAYADYPVGLRNADHWFLPETAASLRRIRAAIDSVTEGPIRDFFLVVFSSVVRKVSRATTQQGRLFLDAVTAEEDALPAFKKRAESAISSVAKLPQNPEHTIRILEKDARLLTRKDLPRPANLVILHPPYFNGYRYSTINSLELAWLGCPLNDVRPAEIREFFKVGKSENVDAYVADMSASLRAAFDCLCPGGTLALMIGDTMIHGEYINVVTRLLNSLPDIKSRLNLIALRVPKHTEATWVASQRRQSGKLGINLCDYILIFKS